jgi:hypothetical protein
LETDNCSKQGKALTTPIIAGIERVTRNEAVHGISGTLVKQPVSNLSCEAQQPGMWESPWFSAG